MDVTPTSYISKSSTVNNSLVTGTPVPLNPEFRNEAVGNYANIIIGNVRIM